MELDDYYKIAYTYYPKSISPFASEFDTAAETLLLKEHIGFERKQRENNWQRLQNEMAEHLNVSVVDMTEAVHDCPCNYCSFISSEDNSLGKIHIWISLLVPYFIIEFYRVNQETKSWEKSGYQNMAGLQSSVKKLFSADPFPLQLLSKTIPDVTLQHSDGDATFREAFFSDYIGNF